MQKIKNGNKSLTSFKHAFYFQEIGFLALRRGARRHDKRQRSLSF
ncbi:hypothetical protein [Helicobacter sp. NHP22-001]|nr:hypothetical protein [Helicobacter sp. NHP22-001]